MNAIEVETGSKLQPGCKRRPKRRPVIHAPVFGGQPRILTPEQQILYVAAINAVGADHGRNRVSRVGEKIELVIAGPAVALERHAMSVDE